MHSHKSLCPVDLLGFNRVLICRPCHSSSMMTCYNRDRSNTISASSGLRAQLQLQVTCSSKVQDLYNLESPIFEACHHGRDAGGCRLSRARLGLFLLLSDVRAMKQESSNRDDPGDLGSFQVCQGPRATSPGFPSCLK